MRSPLDWSEPRAYERRADGARAAIVGVRQDAGAGRASRSALPAFDQLAQVRALVVERGEEYVAVPRLRLRERAAEREAGRPDAVALRREEDVALGERVG